MRISRPLRNKDRRTGESQQGQGKAAEDCRTPKPGGGGTVPKSTVASWSTAVNYRYLGRLDAWLACYAATWTLLRLHGIFSPAGRQHAYRSGDLCCATAWKCAWFIRRNTQHIRMGLIDFILNLAGVLLWFSWRSLGMDPLTRATPATLVGTLRRAEPRRMRGWQFLVGLAALLLLRAVLYGQIGSAVDWTPRLDLYCEVLRFRSHILSSALAYSVLSFTRILAVCYFWGLVLVIINRGTGEGDALQKMLRLQFGPVARWPRLLQALLPLVVVGGLWMALHPLLTRLGITPRVGSPAHLAEQGLLIGGALYFTLQYPLPVFLLLYLVTSYVYLGSNPVWDFIAVTARNLLAPLRWLPLRIAKLDFAPLVGVLLILLLLHWLPEEIQARMADSNVSLWPQ